MPRDHIESKDLYGETACGKNYYDVEVCIPRLRARRKIRKNGIGNYCRSCARAEKLYTPTPTLRAPWMKKLAKLINERLCKGAHDCDAGGEEQMTGPCAGCSSLIEIGHEMGVSHLMDSR